LTEYRNPQNDTGSEKRLLLAFFLVFVVIAVMQYFLPKPQPQPPQQKAADQQQAGEQKQVGEQKQTPIVPIPAGTKTPPPKTPAVVVKVPVKTAPAETETVFDNDLYRITFTNRGALVKSWVLKKYTDDKGKPFDLVNPSVAATLGYPLSLFTYDPALTKKVNEGLYVASDTGVQSTDVTFEYSDGDTSVRKTFRPDKLYILNVETEVVDHGQRIPGFPQWPGGLGDQLAAASYANSKIEWQQNGDIERKAPTSGLPVIGRKWIAGGQTLPGPYDWAALADQYFAVAFMPDSPKDTNLVTLNSSVDIPRSPDKPNDTKDKVAVVGLAVGNVKGVTRERVFAGPKAVDILDSIQSQPGGPDLRGIYDFGTFGFIAKPLFLWLKWTYGHWITNWGWAIAFLTLVITMALLPLRISSMKSSLRMQKIQPQVKAITEKYKRYSITDPRRADMQKEMSALYKKEGVNPVGGCFPLLLQMPFLFAFYSMLGNAIELRQANWLWIHDLSAPDPFHILPIVIMISMFVSQKSAPQAGMDPAQQKMLAFMGPIMIGGMSWGVASGLSIYWALSTLLGYVQQIVINRSELGQQVRKTIEKRAARKR
jgi:YidC/Oxa1 family membrane protein insertase